MTIRDIIEWAFAIGVLLWCCFRGSDAKIVRRKEEDRDEPPTFV